MNEHGIVFTRNDQDDFGGSAAREWETCRTGRMARPADLHQLLGWPPELGSESLDLVPQTWCRGCPAFFQMEFSDAAG